MSLLHIPLDQIDETRLQALIAAGAPEHGLSTMAATNGIPTAITSLGIPIDPEILRLEQMARGGLQPRIANLKCGTG
jgi:hypothetical protein